MIYDETCFVDWLAGGRRVIQHCPMTERPELEVIEGGRAAAEWRLLEMIVSPDKHSIEECEALSRRLERRGKGKLRLAGGHSAGSEGARS